MEQTNQQITPESSLPIKTKIAAWLMIVGSIISMGVIAFAQMFLFIIVLIPLLTFLFLGFSLLKPRKWAWRGVVISSILGLILLGFFCFSILSIVPDINYCFFYNCYLGNGFVFHNFLYITVTLAITLLGSLILLLLDHKNFFKIAH